ncbi:PIN domain-containing protein [Luteolibacter flavescens]|uniref:PIN domain-containing protein n=1 Tax=Luteolibacter flavescens TaxID=1859460 RepID=A0ABT3FTH9_9BACT|nr:TA system VapC family ribonuclease toxin [Luteolibacter flavescens]MCW1886884.1 PIN domain-containing protein [Luteolibacter flavescens]
MTPAVDLPDLNVWLALSFSGHTHHERALDYWNDQRQDLVAFCGVTLIGLPRLLTTGPVMFGDPFSPEVAARKCQELLSLPDVLFIQDEEGLFGRLDDWSKASFFRPKLWTDAWLAALAVENECRLVSFDADFSKFPGVDFLHLTP